MNDEKKDRLEELERQVDQLNSTLQQKTEENRRLETLTNEMTFDTKLKDGAIDELRQQVQEWKNCALIHETAQTKHVEKCALMQFEREEVIQLNNIIEQHENTIKYEGGDRSAIIKKLLQEKFRYTAVVKRLQEELFEAKTYLEYREESFHKDVQNFKKDVEDLTDVHQQMTGRLDEAESKEVKLRQKIHELNVDETKSNTKMRSDKSM